jgi:Uma2 family endonuclease
MRSREATIEDLYRVPGKAELVNGEIVRMPPTGALPGYAGGQIFSSLREYGRRTKLGHAIPDNVGFIVDLPHRRSFCPDVAFHVGELTMDFIQGAPLFAVEVRSKSEHGPRAEHAIAAKRADYFAAGTLVVWDVDLRSDQVVRCYRASDADLPVVYRRGERAAAEPALPGWSMAVDDLFP